MAREIRSGALSKMEDPVVEIKKCCGTEMDSNVEIISFMEPGK